MSEGGAASEAASDAPSPGSAGHDSGSVVAGEAGRPWGAFPLWDDDYDHAEAATPPEQTNHCPSPSPSPSRSRSRSACHSVPDPEQCAGSGPAAGGCGGAEGAAAPADTSALAGTHLHLARRGGRGRWRRGAGRGRGRRLGDAILDDSELSEDQIRAMADAEEQRAADRVAQLHRALRRARERLAAAQRAAGQTGHGAPRGVHRELPPPHQDLADAPAGPWMQLPAYGGRGRARRRALSPAAAAAALAATARGREDPPSATPRVDPPAPQPPRPHARRPEAFSAEVHPPVGEAGQQRLLPADSDALPPAAELGYRPSPPAKRPRRDPSPPAPAHLPVGAEVVTCGLRDSAAFNGLRGWVVCSCTAENKVSVHLEGHGNQTFDLMPHNLRRHVHLAELEQLAAAAAGRSPRWPPSAAQGRAPLETEVEIVAGPHSGRCGVLLGCGSAGRQLVHLGGPAGGPGEIVGVEPWELRKLGDSAADYYPQHSRYGGAGPAAPAPPQGAAQLPGVHQGRVKLWVTSRAYGFITRDDGEDFFFHLSGCRDGQPPEAGEAVSFGVIPLPDGRTKAVDVAPLSGASEAAAGAECAAASAAPEQAGAQQPWAAPTAASGPRGDHSRSASPSPRHPPPGPNCGASELALQPSESPERSERWPTEELAALRVQEDALQRALLDEARRRQAAQRAAEEEERRARVAAQCRVAERRAALAEERRRADAAEAAALTARRRRMQLEQQIEQERLDELLLARMRGAEQAALLPPPDRAAFAAAVRRGRLGGGSQAGGSYGRGRSESDGVHSIGAHELGAPAGARAAAGAAALLCVAAASVCPHPDADQPAELRVDRADGHAYTLPQFLECYGADEGRIRWRASAPASGGPGGNVRVKLHSLINAAKYNGRLGTVVGSRGEQLAVRLDDGGQIFHLLPHNLGRLAADGDLMSG